MTEDEKILQYINNVRAKYDMPLWTNLGQYEDDRGVKLSKSERETFTRAIDNKECFPIYSQR